MQQYYGTLGHIKELPCMGEIGQGKETKNLNEVDVFTVEKQIP
jgi:hypothetical protein